MTIPPPDGSRDRRIEDLSNLHVIHPAAAALLPLAIARRVTANRVSIIGLGFGVLAAVAFNDLPGWRGALLGLVLAACWLVADGLDGMIARATGTASRTGRILDGVCDHGVFIVIYVVLATTIGTPGGWALAIGAGAAHTVQSSLYEGERARFHRRLRLLPPPARGGRVPVYDRISTAADRSGARLDALLAGPHGARSAGDYARRALAPMKAMALLSANVRVGAIALAVLVRSPPLFWWFELGPLTIVAMVTMTWHRRAERDVVGTPAIARRAGDRRGTDAGRRRLGIGDQQGTGSTIP